MWSLEFNCKWAEKSDVCEALENALSAIRSGERWGIDDSWTLYWENDESEDDEVEDDDDEDDEWDDYMDDYDDDDDDYEDDDDEYEDGEEEQ